ncbi:MAG: LysM peptidoglycan-binding domain-containing protein [Janthinobacterium lividum]
MHLPSYLLTSSLVLASTALVFSSNATEPISTQQLIGRLSTAVQSLKTLRCVVDGQERIGKNYVPGRTVMKITFEPLRVYLKNQKGVEVLYVTGQNNNEAWVYPGAFPYITLSLNPNGSLMRKDQHHTTLQAGFGTIADLLGNADGQVERVFTRSFRYAGDTVLQGKAARILRSDYPQFRYVSYKVGRGETIAAVAAHFGCGEYRILERNNLASDDKLTEGQILQVPNSYGRRTILVINSQTYLPISVTVHDDHGLYEKYTFLNVVPNQAISLAEFTKDYKGYKL